MEPDRADAEITRIRSELAAQGSLIEKLKAALDGNTGEGVNGGRFAGWHEGRQSYMSLIKTLFGVHRSVPLFLNGCSHRKICTVRQGS